jgi:hypothetical protein
VGITYIRWWSASVERYAGADVGRDGCGSNTISKFKLWLVRILTKFKPWLGRIILPSERIDPLALALTTNAGFGIDASMSGESVGFSIYPSIHIHIHITQPCPPTVQARVCSDLNLSGRVRDWVRVPTLLYFVFTLLWVALPCFPFV